MTKNRKAQFWGEDKNDDHLVLQIIDGKKTATCCPTQYFDQADGKFHDGGYNIGDLVEVYDLKGNLRCLIKINEKYETTLGDFPDMLWQGECCKNAKEFQDEHFKCWKQLNVTKNTKITATHFELLKAY